MTYAHSQVVSYAASKPHVVMMLDVNKAAVADSVYKFTKAGTITEEMHNPVPQYCSTCRTY